ncbi:MAG: CDP-glycerol glycerophosphotransferase family protein [Propionibacteriaceae bacterium]|nr:CDP-glycerol glycerophosphotransferase family protein [Propionibacteriaceae bacterium]
MGEAHPNQLGQSTWLGRDDTAQPGPPDAVEAATGLGLPTAAAQYGQAPTEARRWTSQSGLGASGQTGLGDRTTPPAQTDQPEPTSAEASHTYRFAAGNLGNLLRAPHYAVSLARSAVSKRDPMLWGVGSAFGVADGALAFARAARDLEPSPRVVWLAADDAEAAAAAGAGFDAVVKDSREGLRATRRAGLLAVTHGFGDVNRYGVTGALIVQLWHGEPLKKLHSDTSAITGLGKLDRVPGAQAAMRWLYRKTTGQIGLFPVSSPVFAPFIRSAFDLDDQVRVLGEPRGDVLFAGPAAERRERARAIFAERLGGLDAQRVFLYAPTWRDGRPDPGVPSAQEWQLIDEVCGYLDAVMVVRPHPLGVGSYSGFGPRVRLLGPAEQVEAIPLLWGVDALVTDYSSILFDYVATRGPYVLFAPDLEEYKASRGLYLDYESLAPQGVCFDWTAVLNQLHDLYRDPKRLADAELFSHHLAGRFHTYCDGRSAERVAITARMLLAKKFPKYFTV